jgi:hypothetical protein
MIPAKKREKLSEALIDEVQAHPSLWDKTCADYKDYVVNVNAWQEILANLKDIFKNDSAISSLIKTVDDVKSLWKNLRDTYTRNKRKEKSGSGLENGRGKREWHFSRALQFLDKVIFFSYQHSSRMIWNVDCWQMILCPV